jgi:protein phosphatase PTC7
MSAARCLQFVRRATRWLPHPDKQRTGGEDAYLATARTIGVADGVGSWSRHHVDAGLYSRSVMKAMSAAVDAADEASRWGDDDHIPTLRAMLAQATAECSGITGSSTFTFGALHGADLEVLQIGDCGCIVLRPDAAGLKVLLQTTPQQYGFNHPLQLGTGSSLTAEDATSTIVPVQAGDLVLLGSDGIFDNIFEDELLRIINRHRASDLDAACAELVDHAMRNAMTNAPTPFAEHAMSHGITLEQAKVDDCTALLAEVGVDKAGFEDGERTNAGHGQLPEPYKFWPHG